MLALFAGNVLAEEAESSTGAGSGEYEYSQAENMMFVDDHLKNIDHLETLTYEFVKDGSLEEGFKDRIILKVTKLQDDGSRAAEVDFLSGERHIPVEPRNSAFLNPVLLLYLQGDTLEMKRLTDGGFRYFQSRMKFAFANTAEIEPVTFTFGGKSVKGHSITIIPYANDPHRKDFEEYADKKYVFILSDEVPGKLYSIEAIIPDMSKKDKAMEEPLSDERITLVDVTPIDGKEFAQAK